MARLFCNHYENILDSNITMKTIQCYIMQSITNLQTIILNNSADYEA
jgi:hypothetical protein